MIPYLKLDEVDDLQVDKHLFLSCSQIFQELVVYTEI